MQKYFKADNMDELYLNIIHDISNNPEFITSPRGMQIKENIGVTMVLTNPKNCLISFPERKMNYAFAAIEKLEYLSGETNPHRLKFYNSNFGNYANKYGSFDGAYPPRINHWIKHIVDLLKSDPDSRQAVISIYGQQDKHDSNDIPCTLTMQFLIRENKLHLITNMRSNDVLWGLPYDTNGFCFLLEGVAAMLGIEMGAYTLIAGSLHIYTEREKQLTDLIDKYGPFNINLTNSNEFKNMPTNDIVNPIIGQIDFDSMKQSLRKFWLLEDELRNGRINAEIDKCSITISDVYGSMPEWLQQYYDVIKEYVISKNNMQMKF